MCNHPQAGTRVLAHRKWSRWAPRPATCRPAACLHLSPFRCPRWAILRGHRLREPGPTDGVGRKQDGNPRAVASTPAPLQTRPRGGFAPQPQTFRRGSPGSGQDYVHQIPSPCPALTELGGGCALGDGRPQGRGGQVTSLGRAAQPEASWALTPQVSRLDGLFRLEECG